MIRSMLFMSFHLPLMPDMINPQDRCLLARSSQVTHSSSMPVEVAPPAENDSIGEQTDTEACASLATLPKCSATSYANDPRGNDAEPIQRYRSSG